MSRKRVSPFERKTIPDKIILQERDLEILALLARYRYLPTSELHRLCFGARSKALLRLRQLYDAELVERISRLVIRGSAEVIYTLSKKGFETLQTHQSAPIDSCEIDFKSSQSARSHLFLNHELALVKFRLATERVCQINASQIFFWYGGAAL